MLHLEGGVQPFGSSAGYIYRTMASLVFFRDQGIAPFQILLDKWVLKLRDTFIQLP
jgi:hypothetical protein